MRVSSLLVLAGLFLLACVARAAAIAADIVQNNAAKPTVAEAEAGRCVDERLGASLLESAKSLKAREEALGEREEALKFIETRIEKRIGELDAVRAEFSAAAEKIANARSAELGKVAAVYSNMKPAQAAAIIDGMDSKFASGLLAQMSSESAASIVAAMDPKKAYAVTVLMANRSALEGAK